MIEGGGRGYITAPPPSRGGLVYTVYHKMPCGKVFYSPPASTTHIYVISWEYIVLDYHRLHLPIDYTYP